jgi:hypothetical protein
MEKKEEKEVMPKNGGSGLSPQNRKSFFLSVGLPRPIRAPDERRTPAGVHTCSLSSQELNLWLGDEYVYVTTYLIGIPVQLSYYMLGEK